VVVGVLKGAFVFTADFVRKLRVPHRVEFVRVRSYRGKTRGRVRVEGPGVTGLRGRDVLVLDGVLDTGRTLRAVLRRLERGRPRRLKVCALLRKRRPGQLTWPPRLIYRDGESIMVCKKETGNERSGDVDWLHAGGRLGRLGR
jgi:hypoxanthine phosphoribosyltransferase